MNFVRPMHDNVRQRYGIGIRFTFGAGYRVYFAEDGTKIVVLLTGGGKKTQNKDIKKAIDYWKEYKVNNDD